MDQLQIKNKVFSNPLYFMAFGFGSGLLAIAPGTWGTVVAIPIYLLISHFSVLNYFVLLVITFVVGIWVCDKVSKELGVHDYSGIVWDEIFGYLFTMFMAPKSFFWVFVGFIVFRIFDIWKPQPIKYIDKTVKGGLGIMLDDLIAAIFAWMVLQFFARNLIS